MSKVQEFINLVSSKIGCGYVWGAQGEVLDSSVLNYLITCFGVQHYHLPDGTKAEKWLGKQVFDCSGLIVWALNRMSLIISDYNTNGLLGLCTRLQDRDQLQPGDLVFGGDGTNTWHVGVYVGNGYTVQAEGTAIGVVKTSWDEFNSWNMYGRLKCLSEEGSGNSMKIGDNGEAVKALQEKLLKLKYNLGQWGADGDFGDLTDSAVRTFQTSHGLVDDGVVGPITMAAIDTAISVNIVDWKAKYEETRDLYYKLRQRLLDLTNEFV